MLTPPVKYCHKGNAAPCQDDVDKAIEGVEAYTRASGAEIDAWFMAGGCPFINTGVQIATIDDYKEVMGLE